MKMNKGVLLVFFIAVCFLSFQVKAQVGINLGLDTIDVEKKQVVKLWSNYMSSKPDSLYDNPYWNQNEKKTLKSYDLLKSEGFINPSLYYFNLKNRILSINKLKDGFLIKTIFYSKRTEDVWVITNIIAKKQGEEYRLYNYLPYYTSLYISKNVGLINYHYYPTYMFNEEKAIEANIFLNNICSFFNIKPEVINYYITPDCDELFRVKGFDYIMTMGNHEDCEFFDGYNNIVYATAIGGENHQHELVHIINNYYPKTHSLLLTGLSAYFGGEKAHRGKPLLYHIKRVNEYLKLHPEIDLNKPENFWSMDSETNPQYVIGALLCDKAIQIGGKKELKKMFDECVDENTLNSFIKNDFKVHNLNTYLRNTIQKITSKNEFNPYISLKSNTSQSSPQ